MSLQLERLPVNAVSSALFERGNDGLYALYEETIHTGGGYALQVPKAVNLTRIQQSVIDSVFYLYSTPERADAGECEGGTGFIVCAPADPSEPNIGSFYAVTAKHNIEDFHCPVIRMNRQQGKADTIPLALNHWKPHPAGDDISIAHLGFISQEYFRFRSIPRELFLTLDVIRKLDIGLGDEVSMVGRFVHHEGSDQNRPAARSGVISLMPDPRDGIAFNSDPNAFKQEAFLIEMRSLAGYSGSPVIFTLPLTYTPYTQFERTLASDSGTTPIGPWLLGIEVGAFVDYSDVFEVERYRNKRKGEVVSRTRTNNYQAKSHTNHSIVIPAWKIDEALDIDEFVNGRRLAHKARQKLLAEQEALQRVEKLAEEKGNESD